jgi:hypothetical protein
VAEHAVARLSTLRHHAQVTRNVLAVMDFDRYRRSVYLVDCLVAHKSHPEVSWIERGVYYNWGRSDFLPASVLWLLVFIAFYIRSVS